MTLTTRLAVAMIALVAIAVSAVGWLSYRSLEQTLLRRARDRIETHSRQVATDLEYYAASATGDVAGFRSAAALQGMVRANSLSKLHVDLLQAARAVTAPEKTAPYTITVRELKFSDLDVRNEELHVAVNGVVEIR